MISQKGKLLYHDMISYIIHDIIYDIIYDIIF